MFYSIEIVKQGSRSGLNNSSLHSPPSSDENFKTKISSKLSNYQYMIYSNIQYHMYMYIDVIQCIL